MGKTLALVAAKHDGQYPDSLDAAKPIIGKKLYGSIWAMGIQIGAADFEICFKGNLNDLQKPDTIKLLQEKSPTDRTKDIEPLCSQTAT